jgi:hypothetical protein
MNITPHEKIFLMVIVNHKIKVTHVTLYLFRY